MKTWLIEWRFALSALFFPPLALLLWGKRAQAGLCLALYLLLISGKLFSIPLGGADGWIIFVVWGWGFVAVRGYDADRRAQRSVDANEQVG